MRPAIAPDDSERLHRILADVGADFVPADLNRLALWDALDHAASDRAVLMSLRHAAQEQTRTARARKQAMARKLGRSLTKDIPADRALRDALARWLGEQREPKPVGPMARRVRLPAASALEYFVGRLTEIFQQYFKRSAGVSVNPQTSEIGGPFIRFAAATLREFEISGPHGAYSLEAIRAAMPR
jgi:hypothetical protein